jgi:RHS repeat-associated protein
VFALPGSHSLGDTTTVSQASRVISDRQTVDGVTAAVWSYGYDNAGRLVSAGLDSTDSRPSVSYTYGYAGSGGCGADPGAGDDSARTSESVVIGGAVPSVTSSCTDFASRLMSASGADALSSVTYNGHGDATTVGGQAITYDSADRVTGIASSAGGVSQSVTYTLDAGSRLISRVAVGSGTGSENSSTVYGYTGTGDGADLQLDSSGALAERYLSLPGGVLLTHRYTTTGGDVWSIPDLHGDIVATTDSTGALTSSGTLFDPFGDPIDPTTGATNPAATPATRTNGLTDAWEGKNQKGYEHVAGLDATLMGARLYLPTWGQFTATDPITGGNPNPYMYPDDPVNFQDLTGQGGGAQHRPNPWTDKVGTIASRLGVSKKAVNDAIHAAKKGGKIGGRRSNPDVEVNTNTGAIRIKGSSGDEIGNIEDYLPPGERGEVHFTRLGVAASLGGGLLLWWLAKLASPACGPGAPVCAIVF